MKEPTLLMLILILPSSLGWIIPQAQQQRHVFVVRTDVTPTDALMMTNKRTISDITHELEDLGVDIKHQTFGNASGATADTPPEGFTHYHESLVHKLRREIHEKDVHYREAIKDLRSCLDRIEQQLEMYALVAKTTEYELEHERDDRLEEHESMRHLMGDIVRLIGRRIKNGPRNLFSGARNLLSRKKKN
jgi:septation ring formation regulator EzrA